MRWRPNSLLMRAHGTCSGTLWRRWWWWWWWLLINVIGSTFSVTLCPFVSQAEHLLSRVQGCKPIGNHRQKPLYIEAVSGMRRQEESVIMRQAASLMATWVSNSLEFWQGCSLRHDQGKASYNEKAKRVQQDKSHTSLFHFDRTFGRKQIEKLELDSFISLRQYLCIYKML